MQAKSLKELQIVSQDFPKQIQTGPDHNPSCNKVVENQDSDVEKAMKSLTQEFADVFDTSGQLKPMNGKPIHIELKEDAVPYVVNGPRPIPIPLREKTKKLIFDMVEQGIIQEVSEPTDWVHPFTVVVKPDGSLRLCVDLRMLNKYVKRPHHPVRSPKDAVSAIPPGARYFTTLDAKSGYFQVELDKESQALTTFITPWGRFKHLRATMGLNCAGDEFNRRTDEALAGLPNVVKVVDDILIHGQDLESHLNDVKKLLQRCQQHGITLNPKKFNLAKDKVKFAGYIVSDKGIEADPEKLRAISHFPKPTNITDLRSFLGLVEQLAGFSKEVAEKMQPLRPLLSSKADFIWTNDHDKAFEESKACLLKAPILATFDPSRPTMLQTDASRTKGLGCALLQKDHEGRWRLIEANSRFISETEARYAMVELELLGVKWAMKKLHNYLFGLPQFELIVDHQPLISILNKQTLDCIDNARILRLKAATSPYNFRAIWRKGKDHKIADALSRAPVQDPTQEDLDEGQEIYENVCAIQKTTVLAIDYDIDDLVDDSPADPILEQVKQHAVDDVDYQSLKKFVNSDQKTLPASLQQYKSVHDEISEDNGLLLMRQRLVIPKKMRKEVLTRLHASHQGIERTLRRARSTVYWPGLTADVKNTVKSCEVCLKYSPSQAKEPMLRDTPPTRVFQEVAADLFEYKDKFFLSIVDRYSGWPSLYEMGNCPNSANLIGKLMAHITRYGCPQRLCSDGGRQFVSQETQDFLKRWGITHRLSSPHYPQSNGLAESGVKSLKALLKKCGGLGEKFLEGYLEYKNTPRPGGKSPAEIVFGHPVRSKVPVHHRAFDKKWLVSLDEHDAKTKELAEKAAQRYDKTACPLPELKIGIEVAVQDMITKLWDRTGIIMSKGSNRKYRIKFPSGRCLWRNRRFLKPVLKQKDIPADKTKLEHDPKTTAEPRRGKRVRFMPDRYGQD